MIILDTHAWLWWVNESKSLPLLTRQYIDNSDCVGIPAICCWEVAMLVAKQRLGLSMDVDIWIKLALKNSKVKLLNLTPEIAVLSTRLPGNFHGDPADRLIAAYDVSFPHLIVGTIKYGVIMHNWRLWILFLVTIPGLSQAEPTEAVTVAAIEAGLAPPPAVAPVVKLTVRGYEELTERGPAGIVGDFPTVMAPIQFDTAMATIRSESLAVLNAYGQALSGNRLQRAVIAIAGHTDSEGSDEANLLLSHHRAQAVRNYLVSHFSIAANRLRVEAYGESQPIESNSTFTGKARNRRVEFIRLGWLE